MLMLKACPKCGGDVTIVEDKYFHYTNLKDAKSYDFSCLQCGAAKSMILDNLKKVIAS